MFSLCLNWLMDVRFIKLFVCALKNKCENFRRTRFINYRCVFSSVFASKNEWQEVKKTFASITRILWTDVFTKWYSSIRPSLLKKTKTNSNLARSHSNISHFTSFFPFIRRFQWFTYLFLKLLTWRNLGIKSWKLWTQKYCFNIVIIIRNTYVVIGRD
jgi:hypothetical protein